MRTAGMTVIHTPDADHERRSFFRIMDEVILSYRRLDPDAPESLQKQPHPSRDAYALSSKLALLQQQSQILLWRVEKDDPALAGYLELLEEKIQTITDYLLDQDSQWETRHTQQVTLSGSCMAYTSETCQEIGARLELRLILLPRRTGLLLNGQVTACQAIPSSQGLRYQIVVDFTEVSEDDQEILISHLIKKQQEQLRSDKEQTQTP